MPSLCHAPSPLPSVSYVRWLAWGCAKGIINTVSNWLRKAGNSWWFQAGFQAVCQSSEGERVLSECRPYTTSPDSSLGPTDRSAVLPPAVVSKLWILFFFFWNAGSWASPRASNLVVLSSAFLICSLDDSDARGQYITLWDAPMEKLVNIMVLCPSSRTLIWFSLYVTVILCVYICRTIWLCIHK